jgi:molybdate transport system substrate-binding protein
LTRILALLLCLAAIPARAADLTVFAAASLTNAMQDAAKAWTAEGHPTVHLSFGASSTLARQIDQGAQANLFASADLKWMDWAEQRHLIVEATRRTLLGNRLVLVMPKNQLHPVTIDKSLNLAALLGPSGRLAVGDPAHVPAGLYAKQALTNLGLWSAAEPHLARAENVRAALLLVERGEVPAGIVYATDAAVAPGVAVAGVFPKSSHDPIDYPFAVTRTGDTPDARAFLAFLGGPEASAIFKRYGFLPAEEDK